MSEFDISDKELKTLLKAEGLDSPSVDFNQLVLDKVKAAETQKAKPVSAPKWLLILLAVLFIAPSLYFVFTDKSALTNPEKLQEYIPNVETGLSSNIILFATLILLIGGIALMMGAFGKWPFKKERVKKS